MRTEILITIIVTACVSIFIWELLRSFIRWMKPEPIKHYVPERHEYPKKDCPQIGCDCDNGIKIELNKDCECDCFGECKTLTTGSDLPMTYNGELPDVHLDRELDHKQRLVSAFDYPKGDFVYNECRGFIPVEYYMRRDNRRYFRGENVKVVVTVKGGKNGVL